MAPDTLFNQAIHLLGEAGTDPALPYSERLYQVAGAAVGFGLQLADCSPAEMDELLRGSGQAGSDLTAAVQAFAAAPIQEELRAAAQSTGIPLLALGAGLILDHFLMTHSEAEGPPGLLEMATAYCLRFTLTLARLCPDLAGSYRELIPTPPTAPIPRRLSKRRPKTPGELIGMASQSHHSWAFASRLRSGAFGWRSSPLACQRVKEAVIEIQQAARQEPVTAAEGAIRLMEKLWPALQHVNTSSGALGNATYHAVHALVDLVIAAPADQKTRARWLDRLWEAFQEDGVSYLQEAGDRWGELCVFPMLAEQWTASLVPTLRHVYSLHQPGAYFPGETAALSCLLATRRYQEVLDLLETDPFPSWHTQRYGVQALAGLGRPDEAIAYAQASRGLNDSQMAIDRECERILLGLGRDEEAYERFALIATRETTYLATFRAIRKKYPHKEPQAILRDLIALSPGEEGKWFATAKQLGLYDLALELVATSPCDPKTLNRAARDNLAKQPRFALGAALAALRWMLRGYGYEVTGSDALDAYGYALQAAEALKNVPETQREIRRILTSRSQVAEPILRVLARQLE